MYTLGLDTSGDMAVVALLKEDLLLGEIYVDAMKNHSVQLMPMIEQLLKFCKVEREEIQLIAVGKGPGSFTGMRIAVATAQGLGVALKVPVVGVSTLMAMAYPYISSDKMVVSLYDAKNNRAFFGGYTQKNGQIITVIPEDVDELSSLGKKLCEEQLIIVGKHIGNFELLLNDREISYDWKKQLLKGESICRIGKKLFLEKEENELGVVLPSYIKLSQAEQNLKD